LGFQVSGFGFRDSGFGFRALGWGLGVGVLRFGVWGLELGVWGCGLRVAGFGSRVSGSGFRCQVSGVVFRVSSFGFRFSDVGFTTAEAPRAASRRKNWSTDSRSSIQNRFHSKPVSFRTSFGFERAQHRQTRCPSLERIRRKALLPFGSDLPRPRRGTRPLFGSTGAPTQPETQDPEP
jgi:hypothetical protein